MIDALRSLSIRDLSEIAGALRSGRLTSPYSAVALQRILPGSQTAVVAAALSSLESQGFPPGQIAVALDLVRHDRDARPGVDHRLDLVTTGPEVPGLVQRDTAVVVRELFAQAQRSVVVAGYAVFQGQKVFQTLAERMVEVPGLQVRMYLDIQRPAGDSSPADELVARFARRFRETQWPTEGPLPDVYYDPRSLEENATSRACLHAKTVVIDEQVAFVSSANFTEAAQERNIEIGLLVRIPQLARQIAGYFDALRKYGLLIGVPF